MVQVGHVDDVILKVFEGRDDEFFFPIVSQSEARSFVKALLEEGLSAATLCADIGESEANLKTWRKGLGRKAGVGNRVIERINRPLQMVLLSDDDEEDEILVNKLIAKLKDNNSNDNNNNSNSNSQQLDKNKSVTRSEGAASENRKEKATPTNQKIATSLSNQIDQMTSTKKGDTKGVKGVNGEEQEESERVALPNEQVIQEERQITLTSEPIIPFSVKDREKDEKTLGTRIIEGDLETGSESVKSSIDAETSLSMPSRSEESERDILQLSQKAAAKTEEQEPAVAVDLFGEPTATSVLPTEMDETLSMEQKIEVAEDLLSKDADLLVFSNPQTDLDCQPKSHSEVEGQIATPQVTSISELLTPDDISASSVLETQIIDHVDSPIITEYITADITSNINADIPLEHKDDLKIGEDLPHANYNLSDDVLKIHQESGILEKMSSPDTSGHANDDQTKMDTSDLVLVLNTSDNDIQLLNTDTDNKTDIDGKTDTFLEITESYDSDFDSTKEDLPGDVIRAMERLREYKRASRDGPGYVYVFGDGDVIEGDSYRLKVGATRYPQKRLAQAQLFNPRMTLVSAVQVSSRKAAGREVQEHFKRFAIEASDRWFEGPLCELLEIFSQIAMQYEPETSSA